MKARRPRHRSPALMRVRYGMKTNAIKPPISNTTTAAPRPKPSENENGFSGGGLGGPAGGGGTGTTEGTDGIGFGGLVTAGA